MHNPTNPIGQNNTAQYFIKGRQGSMRDMHHWKVQKHSYLKSLRKKYNSPAASFLSIQFWAAQYRSSWADLHRTVKDNPKTYMWGKKPFGDS